MKTVFFDIDSQLDFLYPSGALYVPGAERIAPAIAQLNRYAAQNGIPVVSTTDAHSEADPEFAVWPHHCVSGTLGQRKAEVTLLDGRTVIPNRECSLDIGGARQLIVEKQTVDVFLSANLGRVVEALKPQRCVIYGVVTEICVLYAARGLMKTGAEVLIVSDAIKELNAADSARALAEVRAGGGKLESVSRVCAL